MNATEWRELSEQLLHSAVLAPSSHNTQPWIFRLTPGKIRLLADRTRALPVNDPEDRELVISCGCALMNIRVAAAGAGVDAVVEAVPDEAEPDLLAKISIVTRPSREPELADLAAFVSTRRTYRKRFEDRPVESEAIRALVDAAEAEGAWLRPFSDDPARLKLAEFVAEADAALWANPSWRRELAVWMHPRRKGDGLTVPAVAAPVARLVVRTFDMGNGLAAKDRDLAEASPVLAVLGTDRDNPSSWLVAGQAVQRLLLVACRAGLQASHLNQPIQVAFLRPKLQHFVGGGFPQILLRVGHPAEEVPPAPRRALSSLIDAVAS